jgi:hypothetical protein
MFIRWQTHRSKGGLYRGKTTRIRAILAKSVSVDGKSRQRCTQIGHCAMSVLRRFCCKSRLARMVPVNGSTEDARLDLPASKLSTQLLRYAMH